VVQQTIGEVGREKNVERRRSRYRNSERYAIEAQRDFWG
jgi:hypothetical protein